MFKRANTVLLIFFIMTLTAGLISGQGLTVYAQTQEGIDDDEIIDCSRNPEYCEGEDELMIFTVYANELVGPYGFADIASAAENEPGSLILLTCENESAEGGYLNRRVVFARPK